MFFGAVLCIVLATAPEALAINVTAVTQLPEFLRMADSEQAFCEFLGYRTATCRVSNVHLKNRAVKPLPPLPPGNPCAAPNDPCPQNRDGCQCISPAVSPGNDAALAGERVQSELWRFYHPANCSARPVAAFRLGFMSFGTGAKFGLLAALIAFGFKNGYMVVPPKHDPWPQLWGNCTLGYLCSFESWTNCTEDHAYLGEGGSGPRCASA